MNSLLQCRGGRSGIAPWNKGLKGCYTKEALRKMSEKKKENVPWNKETLMKQSESHKGRMPWNKGLKGCYSDEARKKISEKMRGDNNPSYKKHLSEKTRRKISEGHMRAVKRGCYSIRPTAPEVKFAQMCSRHGLPYKYTGDGSFWIENVNPDFVESNGRKIAVEIYGDYWHKLLKRIKNDKQREAVLSKYGWKLLILWEHELKELSEDEIVRRVMI